VTPPLESLATCFQGLLPAQFFTCSRDGVPNAAYLSHVDYVDSAHVALSFQFFNKSRRNIAENPHALVIVIDPDTGQGWQLRLRYVRSETDGPLFERMALRIEAIASYCGLKGIFKLRAADIYEVRAIEPARETMGAPAQDRVDRDIRAAAQTPVFTLKAMQDLAARIQRADCLEMLVDSILAGLDEIFGFKYSMILVPGEEPGVAGRARNDRDARVWTKRRRRRSPVRRGHCRIGCRSTQTDSHLRIAARDVVRLRDAPRGSASRPTAPTAQHPDAGFAEPGKSARRAAAGPGRVSGCALPRK
jgi:hypothetical protein